MRKQESTYCCIDMNVLSIVVHVNVICQVVVIWRVVMRQRVVDVIDRLSDLLESIQRRVENETYCRNRLKSRLSIVRLLSDIDDLFFEIQEQNMITFSEILSSILGICIRLRLKVVFKRKRHLLCVSVWCTDYLTI